MSGINIGVDNSSPIQRFVTEDAYIRTGIGTTGVVNYGSVQIGPQGSIASAPLQTGNISNLSKGNISKG